MSIWFPTIQKKHTHIYIYIYIHIYIYCTYIYRGFSRETGRGIGDFPDAFEVWSIGQFLWHVGRQHVHCRALSHGMLGFSRVPSSLIAGEVHRFFKLLVKIHNVWCYVYIYDMYIYIYMIYDMYIYIYMICMYIYIYIHAGKSTKSLEIFCGSNPKIFAGWNGHIHHFCCLKFSRFCLSKYHILGKF